MSPRTRQRYLFAGLALTLVATLATAWIDSDEAVDGPLAGASTSASALPRTAAAAPSDRSPALAASASAAGPALLARGPWSEPAPAALRAWGVAAASARAAPTMAAPAPSAASAPQPPALQLRYVGRITHDGKRRALLDSPQGTRVVAEGELLDGQWRVQRIGDDAIDLQWLPSGSAQSLPYARS